MKIQWHSGFYGAAELEFSADRKVLELSWEYNLSKEALRMDLLIIRKTADIQIKNEIGRMFRTYNVIEYKSPDDRDNIEAVLQVSIAANQQLYERIRRDSVMCDALRELMREEIEEEKRNAVQDAVREAEQKAEKKAEKTLLETIKNLMDNLNLTADQVMSAMNLPGEKWGEYRMKL